MTRIHEQKIKFNHCFGAVVVLNQSISLISDMLDANPDIFDRDETRLGSRDRSESNAESIDGSESMLGSKDKSSLLNVGLRLFSSPLNL